MFFFVCFGVIRMCVCVDTYHNDKSSSTSLLFCVCVPATNEKENEERIIRAATAAAVV